LIFDLIKENMSILPHPETEMTIDLPPRRGRVIAETDVLVVGGGLAGLGAALGSAQAGAATIVVEE
jgi:heterodisulfide reductase subunit A-like polyferredoxin